MYYKCDDCGKEFEFDDTCFLGPIERMQEEECDPMMDLDCLKRVFYSLGGFCIY